MSERNYKSIMLQTECRITGTNVGKLVYVWKEILSKREGT